MKHPSTAKIFPIRARGPLLPWRCRNRARRSPRPPPTNANRADDGREKQRDHQSQQQALYPHPCLIQATGHPRAGHYDAVVVDGRPDAAGEAGSFFASLTGVLPLMVSFSAAS